MLEITRAVVDAVHTPVTVKTRLGWDDEHRIIADIAEALQDCGIAELAIHGRTRSQMYRGDADWTLIGQVKNNPRIHIPIIGNGDITTPERAKECFQRYGVDAIMIGRATFGCPWIFQDIQHYLNTGELLPARDLSWCVEILKEHVERSIQWIGDERKGIVHSRRHFAASPAFKGLFNFRQTRIALLRAETKQEVFAIMDDIVNLFAPTQSPV
jgi:nifR3 family TIM-barrel protein